MNAQTAEPVRVRPRASLGRAWLVAALVAGAPFFGVLYWLAAEVGQWRHVLALHVLVLAVALWIWTRHIGSYAEVTDTHVDKQAFLGWTSIERSRVASALIAHTWRPGSSDSIPQLLLLDDAGNTLMRMSGVFWSLDSMMTIANALEVDLQQDEAPVSTKEFLTTHPSAAFSYERRPWLPVLGGAAAVAGAFVVTSWLMSAIGASSVLSLPMP